MPEENLEVLARLNEAFNRRDVDAALRCLHHDAELHPGIAVPDEDPVYAGHGGLTRWFANALEPWEAISVEQEEVIESPPDRVLAVERWRFRGRDGLELELELPNVYTFRDGLIVRIDGFTERSDARAAAGLPH
jgi:ketosteroid isomerase-like protein